MNSAATVANMISNWKTMGYSKAELTVLIAEACIGWPYVWGSYGQEDVPSTRRAFMDRSAISEGDRELIKKRCQVLNGSRATCDGCAYYPGGAKTRMFDCRGFTRWVLSQAGCGTIQGAGATSQWNDNSNWSQKGEIKDMPSGAVCCVFKKSGSKMEHTGLHIGGGNIIHCSVEVKRGKTTDRGWTHYAIPKGMEGDTPVPTTKPTIRRGSTGEYVTECQRDLIKLGYSVGPSGADGVFGRNTETAVKAFQAKMGLTSDGIVGAKTWEALDKAVGPDPSEKLYTVTIQHLSKAQADELRGSYFNVNIQEEA